MVQLHIQNIFDALNPTGQGVDGTLKLRCLNLQNRVVGLANSGDIVAVTDDCPTTFVDYMLGLTGMDEVLSLHQTVSPDLNEKLNSRSIFAGLAQHFSWGEALERAPLLNPYIRSPSFYVATQDSGLIIPEEESRTWITRRLAEQMNDKREFYRECTERDIPIPRYWSATEKDLSRVTLEALDRSGGSLYIRPTRSGGTVGNLTIEKINSEYQIRGSKVGLIDREELAHALQNHVKGGYWSEYVISELVNATASPGTLFFADDQHVTIISHTLQILDRNRVFLGFKYPIEDESIRQHFELVESFVQSLVEPWRKRGFRGYGNLDWMVTSEAENVLVAERNARQTAVVAPLTIVNQAMDSCAQRSVLSAPPGCLFTRDDLEMRSPARFDEVYSILKSHGLLIEELNQSEGVVITMPPLPLFGNRSVGIMAIAMDTGSAQTIYKQAIGLLADGDAALLPEESASFPATAVTKCIPDVKPGLSVKSAFTIWHFAFGSNMDPGQMRERGVDFKASKKGILRDFGLTFNFDSSRWNGSAADIIPSCGETVEGVLYLIGQEGLQRLDSYEGVHLADYCRKRIPTEDASGKTVDAICYQVVRKSSKPIAPSKAYLERMLKGALANVLSPAYVEMLRSFLR